LQPFSQEGVDLVGGQTLADGLQALGVGAGLDAVIQGLVSNLFALQSAFGIFMAVEAELGVVRKVGTKLQEKRPEVVVHAVEIILVH